MPVRAVALMVALTAFVEHDTIRVPGHFTFDSSHIFGRSHFCLHTGTTAEPSLYFQSVLIRIDDMDFHQVSSSGQTPPKPPLLSCHHIPSAASAVHLQYIEYYCFPGECLPALACLLLPELELHVMINVDDIIRLQLNHYHYLTLLRFQEQLQALLEGLKQTVNSQSDFLIQASSCYCVKICVGMQIPVVAISLLLPASISPVSPKQPVDSERSSLVGSELADGDISGEKDSDKRHLRNKRGIVDMFLGPELGEDPQEVLNVQKENASQLHQQNNKDLTKDSLPRNVLANDAMQTKELSIDLFLGKEFARDALLNTLDLTRETFSLGKERMQHFLSDTKHKNTDVLHNRDMLTSFPCTVFGYCVYGWSGYVVSGQ
ncbi:unnamed protein product [Ranitomeya imitator]|uniref:Uncharacterized protein n=1 Tax=Ranitomeya imitator TaxID=111125 RepID=A0ABN9LXJ5_9NEOB|nr:unnamed protein product [Ranitomeya imitator]